MIKIVKISSQVVSTIILIVVVIPMILSLILQNSGVQTWVVDKATDYISQKIDSRISIGKIDIGKFYNIKIYDFFVESKIGLDTLLYTKKLTTRLSAFDLGESDLALDFVEIEGGEFNLCTRDSVTNIKEIIDRIRGGKPPKEGAKPFKMSVGSVELDDFTFRFSKENGEVVPYGINYQDMEMSKMSMELDRFRLVNDSINAKVDHISFVEKGGITLDNFSLDEMIIASSGMMFRKGEVSIDNTSYLKFKSVQIIYNNWMMEDYVNSVPMEADVIESHISLATVAKFTKQERGWQSVIDFDGTFKGTVSSMNGVVRRAVTGSTEITDTEYFIYNVTDINNTIFDLTVGSLVTKPADVATIISDFSTTGAMALPSVLVANSSYHIKGSFLGQIRNFDAECKISLPNVRDGYVKANLNLKTQKNGIFLDGSVLTNDVNTQKIIVNKSLERVSANVYVRGVLNASNSDVTISGRVDSLLYNKYNYNSISLNGDLVKNSFSGYVGCDDPNLDFKFNGLIDFTNNIPSYNFNLDLARADLSAVGLNLRDSVSVLSGRIMADGYGDKLDNLDATIIIDNLRYINHSDTTIADNPIRIESYNDDKSKSMTITSDYFDLSLKGVHSYSDLIDYIMKSAGRFIPALTAGSSVGQYVGRREIKITDSANDYYVLTLDVKKPNNLATIFVPSLTLAEGSKLSFIFNPSADSFSLNLASKYIAFDNKLFYNILVDSKNVGDLVNFFVRVEEIYLGSTFFPNFSVIGDVSQDVVNADFGFSNSENNTYAIIKSSTKISRRHDGLEYKISMLPSTLNLYKDVWKSVGGEITIGSNRIAVNNYSLTSTNQSLNVNGVISASEQDTIRMTFDNFSLKPLALVTSKIGFDMDGAIVGDVIGSAILNKEGMSVDANLRFKNNVVNGIKLPDGHFYTSRDDLFSRKFNFALESEGDQYIWGSVDPKEGQYLANVKIPKFDVSIIAPFLNGIAAQTEGFANVDVTLSNPKKYFEINGEVDIPSLYATIVPTNARYNISGKAMIKDNQYSLENGVVKDDEGGTGVLNGWMTNEKYKKVKYNISVKANKILGLNTTEKDNANFYGKAYASGDVVINGDRNKITLTVDASSSKRSTFFLPLGGRTISEVGFIKFASPKTEDTRRRLRSRAEGSAGTTGSASLEMKLRLTATPLLEAEIVMDPLTGSSIKATGNGIIDIDIQPANEVFTINGEYAIDKGTYRFILPNFNLVDKLFLIKNGSWIRWSGNPLNAALNVDAIYELKASLAPILGDGPGMSNRVGVNCVLALNGELLHPDITLGIEVPGVGPEEQSMLRSALNTQEAISTQLFFLLFTSSFYATSEGAGSNGTLGNIGLMGTTTTGIEFLTSQIKNIFSSDKFDFGINYRPENKSNHLSDEFEIDFSAPIWKDRIYIDVTGNYRFKDNGTSANSDVSNWSGDVFLTWLLNNSGNLSLKAFTRTIDTFDENLGFQESGVGIYFKSDFDNFKDLRLRYRDYIFRRKEAKIEKREKKKLKTIK